MKYRVWLAAVLLTAWLPVQAEVIEVPGIGSDVTVHIDAHGIPTIIGEREVDVTFVQGYLHAKDRFFQMDFLRRVASGTLAELLGPSVLSNDITLRTLGLRRAAWQSYVRLSPTELAWVQAYANGVNHFLDTQALPVEYGALELNLADRWSPVDSLVIGKLLAFQLSFDQSLSAISNTIRFQTYQGVGQAAGFDGAALFLQDLNQTFPIDGRVSIPDWYERIGLIDLSARPAAEVQSTEGSVGSGKAASAPLAAPTISPNFDAVTVDLATRYRDALSELPFLAEGFEVGSNWWAVAGEHTESGFPLFANDPHLSLDMAPIFMNENLVIRDEGLAVSGVMFAGAPVNAQACNQHICWGSTVNRLDVTDVFLEDLRFNNFGLPTHTVYKGQPERILYGFQSYFVNQIGDGEFDNVVRAPVGYDQGAITFIVPRRNFGPIVELLGDNGLSVQYTGWGPTFELAAFRAWSRAQNLEDFQLGLRDFAFGSQNFLYADVEGNIAYFIGGEMPLRADLQENTVDGGIPPWFIRTGNGTLNHEWLLTDDPQPGQATPYQVIPREEMPQVVNPPWGYLANANNDPVGTSRDGNPLSQLRPGGEGIYYLNTNYSDLRMARADRVLEGLVQRGNVTVDDMKALQADNFMIDAQFLLPFLAQATFNAIDEDAWPALTELFIENERMADAMALMLAWEGSSPTGLAGGFDPGGDPSGNSEPSGADIVNSVATTIYSVWRGQIIRNTIDATLQSVGLGGELPGQKTAWRALVAALATFDENQGFGASGLNFFNVDAPTREDARDFIMLSALKDALDLLASDAFAPAFGNSTDLMDYRWGMLHRAQMNHPLGGPFSAPVAGGFTPVAEGLPGIPRAGGFNVLDASSHNARANSVNGFTFSAGAARRNVTTLTPQGPVGEEIIPGGRSGFFLSPFYTNQLRLWLVNDYLPLNIGEDAAIEASADMKVFTPRM